MNTPAPANIVGQSARALLKNLQTDFAVFRDYHPLAIGVDKALRTLRPELDRKSLRIALSMHTHSSRYLKTLEKATHRVCLDGSLGEEISAEHRQYASDLLRERQKKESERRQAERQAAAAERQAQAEERIRTEKLNLLMEKFGKDR